MEMEVEEEPEKVKIPKVGPLVGAKGIENGGKRNEAQE